MAETKQNTSYKVKAAPVVSLENIVPEVGAMFTFNGEMFYADKWGIHRMTPSEAVAMEAIGVEQAMPGAPEDLDYITDVIYNNGSIFTVDDTLNTVTAGADGDVQGILRLYASFDTPEVGATFTFAVDGTPVGVAEFIRFDRADVGQTVVLSHIFPILTDEVITIQCGVNASAEMKIIEAISSYVIR